MRYKLLIEYDGTLFVGWQRQQNPASVQQVLEEALAVALRAKTTLFGSGRTDAGVHALGQAAHFDAEKAVDVGKLRESLNALVRPWPIAVRDIQPVSDTFHARFSARQREYLYLIQNTRFPPALTASRVWWVVHPLNAERMQEAGNLLLGKHDFSTFRATACQAKSPVKTLDFIEVGRQEEMVSVRVRARSFLHHQVRNIVGSLVCVGTGKWSVGDFRKAFEKRDRTAGGETAPACGLYFVSVRFSDAKVEKELDFRTKTV